MEEKDLQPKAPAISVEEDTEVRNNSLKFCFLLDPAACEVKVSSARATVAASSSFLHFTTFNAIVDKVTSTRGVRRKLDGVIRLPLGL